MAYSPSNVLGALRHPAPSTITSKKGHRITKDPAPSRRDNGMESGLRTRRVWKACERCRVRKTKCDGDFPCRKCKEDGLLCMAGARKKVEVKQSPTGCADSLENTQHALSATIQKLYAMVRDGSTWSLAEPELDARGQPLTHDIASVLGCLRPYPDLPYISREDICHSIEFSSTWQELQSASPSLQGSEMPCTDSRLPLPADVRTSQNICDQSQASFSFQDVSDIPDTTNVPCILASAEYSDGLPTPQPWSLVDCDCMTPSYPASSEPELYAFRDVDLEENTYLGDAFPESYQVPFPPMVEKELQYMLQSISTRKVPDRYSNAARLGEMGQFARLVDLDAYVRADYMMFGDSY